MAADKIRAWSAITYQKPAAPLSSHSSLWDSKLSKPDAQWKPYRFPADSARENIQGHTIETTKEFAKLSQIIYRTITAWCGATGKVTARDLLKLYQQYTTWWANLPDYLTNTDFEGTDEKALPHVFSLQ
jgi:hypothetical protein